MLFVNITKNIISHKKPIPATHVHLGELMRLILKENFFKFNDLHFLQTQRIAMGKKLAVAFAVIFMAHIEKQLLAASPQKPIFWKRFSSILSSYD